MLVPGIASPRFAFLQVVVATSLLLGLAGVLTAPTSTLAQTAEWRPIAAEGPAARWDHTLAADPETGTLILFGGRDGAGVPFGDTWRYVVGEGSWVQVAGPAPSPRFGQAVAIDATHRALYLFGGQAGTDFFNDTWRFDLDSLTWAEIATGNARPSPRYGTSAVLDGNGNILVSHGFTSDGRFDDTWSLDPATGVWTDISPDVETRPLKRCLHEAVWDAASGRMLLFGGCASGFGPCPLGDLWAFDPAARTWTELTPASGPTARSNPALIHDSHSGSTWLIDGLTEAGYTADLWTLDLAAGGGAPGWVETSPAGAAPEPRASHDAAVLGGDVYLFGGFGANGALADFWLLTGVGGDS
jgi:hypothetical protein